MMKFRNTKALNIPEGNAVRISVDDKTIWKKKTLPAGYTLLEYIESTGEQDNGILTRDYVPCINADGKAGMFDKIGKQFYGNDGEGEFIVSEEV